MKNFIVANWKCNPTTLKGAKLLFDSIKKKIKNVKNAEVVICPPFIYLPILSSPTRALAKFDETKVSSLPSLRSGGRRRDEVSSPIRHQSPIKLGSQNLFYEEKGAFTGEISPLMLKDLGVEYVIIGHSERRKHQKETDKIIEKKLKAALRAGLKPILCVDKISQLPGQIKKGFIVAYEPLFAIGTGKACSPQRAKKMRLAIKKKIKVPVLYGGSVNSQNAADYLKKAGFQGLLVGGASLDAKEFAKIALLID